MISKRRQRGMSAYVAVYILASLGAFGLVGLKLVPVYLESFKVDDSIEALVEDPRVGKMSKNQIAESLVKRLDINEVRRIHEKNLKDYVVITKKGDKVTIQVNYRAEAPLFSNVILVADFQKQANN